MEIGSHEELLRKTENMPDCTGHRQDGIKKNRSYISNFKTVANQLLNFRELYLQSGFFLCYNQVQELRVEWKQN